MAVMVKDASESASMRPEFRLAIDSFAGVLYFLGSIGLVFKAIPYLWTQAIAKTFGIEAADTPVSISLQIGVMAVVALGLAALALKLLGGRPLHGLRAGIFIGVVEVLLVLLLTSWIGGAIQGSWQGNENAGLAVCTGLAIGLIALCIYGFVRPDVSALIIRLEDQGWFTAAAYKRSQGQRVRRGTIMGILVLAGCGIYTLLHHRSLTAAVPDWQVPIPFSDLHIVLLPDLAITLPLALAVGAFWLAYRVVNFPVFADFLIATEAELNKVSWTTRKRLIQDTVVVLATVALLTAFLFVVDQGWAFILSRVGVLQVPEAKQQVDSAAGPKW